MPAWVNEGFSEYAKRFPPECALNLIQVPALKRSKTSDLRRIVDEESHILLSKAPANTQLLGLDVSGERWDTAKLAIELESWMSSGMDTAILIGGPEGLSAACKQRMRKLWSLSALTFPHMLVRVIAAEALYRAWSLLANHPYHRE